MTQTAVARMATFNHSDLLLGKPMLDSQPMDLGLFSSIHSFSSPAIPSLFEHGSIKDRCSAGSRGRVTSATSSHSVLSCFLSSFLGYEEKGWFLPTGRSSCLLTRCKVYRKV